MKKRLPALLLAAALLLSGCSLYEAEYNYSEPYSGGVASVGGNAAEVRNLSMLKSALLNLISAHAETGSISFQHYSGSPVDDLAAVCLEIRTENPLGAYAVDAISCDTSRIVSYYIADVSISYRRTAEEIRSIREVFSLEEICGALREAMEGFEQTLLLRVYSAGVEDDYFPATVHALYLADPIATVVEPEVAVESFPDEGANRIYALTLRYGRAASILPDKVRKLRAAVAELAADAPDGDETLRARWCAETVWSLLQGDAQGTYAGTAYGAIVEHSADSAGAALAMQALCAAVGLDCRVVEGSAGAMGAERHCWNILALDGEYGHTDVTTFGAAQPVFGLSDDRLWGTYIWDTAAYPACAGTARYPELFPEKQDAAETEGEPEPAPEPSPSDAPAASEEPQPAPADG